MALVRAENKRFSAIGFCVSVGKRLLPVKRHATDRIMRHRAIVRDSSSGGIALFVHGAQNRGFHAALRINQEIARRNHAIAFRQTALYGHAISKRGTQFHRTRFEHAVAGLEIDDLLHTAIEYGLCRNRDARRLGRQPSALVAHGPANA